MAGRRIVYRRNDLAAADDDDEEATRKVRARIDALLDLRPEPAVPLRPDLDGAVPEPIVSERASCCQPA